MRYRPDLDGIRALAVIAVLLSHSTLLTFLGGWMGVDVFFVLSGYLITALLLSEHHRSGRIAFGRFYMRRALRLYPALVVTIVLTGLLAPVLDGWAIWGRSALFAGTYTMDFTVFWHLNNGVLGHTWSLAVEEQFYLVWPPVLAWFLTRKRNPAPWVWLAVVAGTVGLAINASAPDSNGLPDGAFLPWFRFPQLLLGCVVALALAARPAPRWVGRPVVGIGLAVAAAALMFDAGKQPRIPNMGWQAPAIGLVAAAMIVHLANEASPLRRLLGVRPLAALGRRSYGFYLYHVPALRLVERHVHEKYAVLGLTFVLTLAVTLASYRYVELPFLRLKKRFQPATSVVQASSAVASASH